jgi:hypothetical protein
LDWRLSFQRAIGNVCICIEALSNNCCVSFVYGESWNGVPLKA